MHSALTPIRAAVIACTAALLLAACDGDSGNGSSRAVRAPAFVDCFESTGREAVVPAPGQESVFANVAASKGFDVAPVNIVARGRPLDISAYLAFFEDEATAGRARRETKATSLGGPLVQNGNVVIGYVDEKERRAVEPATRRCL